MAELTDLRNNMIRTLIGSLDDLREEISLLRITTAKLEVNIESFEKTAVTMNTAIDITNSDVAKLENRIRELENDRLRFKTMVMTVSFVISLTISAISFILKLR